MQVLEINPYVRWISTVVRDFSEGHRADQDKWKLGVIIWLNIWFSNSKIKCTEKSKEAENCQLMLLLQTHSWRHLKAECLWLPDLCPSFIVFILANWVREFPLFRKCVCLQIYQSLESRVNKLSGCKGEPCLTSSN